MRILPALLLLLPAAAFSQVSAGFSQDGCPPVRFASVPSAALLPTPSSHRVLVKQPDGSFTAFELSNTSPYALLDTISHFDRQLRPCAPASTGLSQFVWAIAPEPGGGYLVASSGSSTINIAALDTGLRMTGQFQLSGYVPSIQFADVNNDGKLDLLAYTEPDYMNEVLVYLGSGAANFNAPVITHLPSSPQVNAFTVADVNRDGKPDLVSVGYQTGAFVSLGNGDGTFQTATMVVPEANTGITTGLAVADLNADGKPDLVMTGQVGNSEPVVLVALGNGDGTFGAAAQFPIGAQGAVAIGDLNGDGIPDIVAGNATILFGDGKGGFPTRHDYLAPQQSNDELLFSTVIITDFNADGIPDIVTGVGNASVIAGDTATVLLGTGQGRFAAAPLSLVPGTQELNQLDQMVSADFNSDGTPDLAVLSEAGDVSVLLGAGDGTFSVSFTSAIPGSFGGAGGLAFGDFNRDGVPDLAAVNNGQSGSILAILLGKGDGTFQPPLESTMPIGAIAIVSGDFNADGKPDLALLLSSIQAPNAASDVLDILLGDGAGSFAKGPSYATGPGATSLVGADFNGDGRGDLVVANAGADTGGYRSGGNLTLFLSNGDGSFALPPATSLGPPARLSPAQLITADFNRDGKPDLAFSLFESSLEGSGFAVMLGTGGGAFLPPVIYAGADSIHAGDINGDGIPDLVSGAGYQLGNGDGSFQALVNTGIRASLLADFNGDGKLDLASAQPTGVAVELNASETQSLPAIVSAASFAPGPLQLGSIATAYGSLPAGVGVTVTDATGTAAPATLLYQSTSQINFVLPSGLSAGPATVSFGPATSAAIVLTPSVPQIFTVNTGGLTAAYATQISSSGAVTIQPVFTVTNSGVAPVPLDVSSGSTYLTFYCTGTPTQPVAIVYPNGFNALQLVWSGPDPSFPGVQQINALFNPGAAGAGYVSMHACGAPPVYFVIN